MAHAQSIIIIVLLLPLLVFASLYVIAPDALAKGLIRTGRLVAGLATRSLRMGSLEISYLEGGQGQVLLMLHGFGADKDNWLRIARSFTDRFRVIAPDLPGFGDSSVPGDMRFDVESQVTRLIEFADALGLGQMHIIGNSMGGQIAAVLAARRPERVVSLALLDPLGVEQESGVDPSITMRKLETGENVLLPGNRQAFDNMLGLMFYEAPWVPGPVTGYYANTWISRTDLLARVFAAITGEYVALAPLLPTLLTPTLIMWGANDEILPAGGARLLAQGIASSRMVVIPECGHLPMLEKPRETAAHYRAFLDALPRP